MAEPSIELVVTDLDGTLWGPDGRAHPRTTLAVAALRTVGMPVLAATGRRLASVVRQIEANSLEIAAAVVLDGVLGKDLARGTTFHRRPLCASSATLALRACLAAGVEPCVVVDDPARDLLVGDAPSTHPDHLRANADRTRRCDLQKVATTVPVLSFLVCGGDETVLRSVAVAVGGAAAATVSRDTHHGGHALSIRAAGVGKWSGVLTYCALHQVNPARVLAIGDGDNDLDLLASASVACVPVNGSMAALRLASHVIPPPDAGGWAEILELLR